MSCFPPVLADGVDISDYIADVNRSHVTDFTIRRSVREQKESLIDAEIRRILSEMLAKGGIDE